MATKKRAPAKGPQILNVEEYERVKGEVKVLSGLLRNYEHAEEQATFKLLIGTAWRYGPDVALIVTGIEKDGCLKTLQVFDSALSKRPKKAKPDLFSWDYPRITVEHGYKAYPPADEGAESMDVGEFWRFYDEAMQRLCKWRADTTTDIITWRDQ